MANVLQKNEVISKAILDIETLAWESVEREPYFGPWALCDRAASNVAKKAAGTAGDVATQEGSNATSEHAQLTPFYRQEMNATHGFNPEQTNELLNFAEGPAAGSAATTAGQAASESARTRNTSGFSSALDQAARDRNKAVGTASEGVGVQDVLGAKALNQEGAKGMAGLYDTDTGAMLKSMGIQNQDLQTQIDAGKSGWFENLTNGVNAGANLISAMKKH